MSKFFKETKSKTFKYLNYNVLIFGFVFYQNKLGVIEVGQGHEIAQGLMGGQQIWMVGEYRADHVMIR